MISRRDELALNLESVHQQISHACAQSHRDASDIAVIAVTKTWPASDVALLSEIGVTDVGENRDQEARPKHDELSDLPLTWHAIGQLQTNKVKSVCEWADVLHSVDRQSLVSSLAKEVPKRAQPLGVFVQISLDEHPDDKRGGCHPGEFLAIAESLVAIEGIQLLGVMGVGPLIGDVHQAFAHLQEYSVILTQAFPQARFISAGMSDDFEIAIKYGATHLRIGSLILGHRSPDG